MEEGRLIVKRITVHNFKSFSGTVVIGDLDKKFSCVVGPNGSGKSNVVDAILFVFGISTKKLRQNKAKDLIHHSTKFRDCESCSVEILFEKVVESESSQDGFEFVPNSQLTVRREVDRSNDATKYFLNNHRVQKVEIVQKLRQLGIDLEHNRFLIMQGEVEQISLMKAKGQNENQVGFLEYLEDVIGTQHYIELILQQQQRLESVTEERKNMVNRLKMAESERDGLSAAHESAKHYNDLELQMLDCNYQKSVIQIHKYQRIYEASQKEYDDIKSQFKQIQSQDKEKLKQVQQMKHQLDKTSKQLNRLKDEKEQLEQFFQELECQDRKISNQQKHQRGQVQKVEAQLEKVQQEIASAVDEETIIQKKNENQQACQQLNQQKTQLEERLQILRDGVAGEIEDLRGRLADLQTHLAPAKTNIQQLESEREQLQKQVENVVKHKQETGQKLQTCQNELQTAIQEQQQLAQQTQQLQEQVQNYQNAREKQQGTQQQLRQQENDLLNQLNELRGRVREAQQDSNQHIVSQNIMHAVQGGELGGVYGRLGGLGTIDNKYDVAISVAAGGQLEWIITDTMQDSQQVIQFVKERELGVVQAQCLHGLNPPPRTPQQDLPKGISRLYDLVNVSEEKFASAFWKALGNTLVADNIDIAYNYRKKKSDCPKIVTLKGEVSRVGVLIGGGSTPKGGKMKAQLSYNPEELQRAEQQIQQLEQQLQDRRAQANNQFEEANAQEQQFVNANTQLQSNVGNLRTVELRIGELRQEHDKLTNQIRTLDQQEQNLVQNNHSRCQQIEQNIQHIQQESAQLLQQEQKLQNQLENAGGPEVPVLRQNISQLSEQIKKVESDIRQGDSDLNQMKKKQQQKQESLNKLSKQLEKHHTKITELEREKQQLEEQGLEVNTDKEKVAAKLEEIEGKERELRTQYEELKSSEQNNRKQLLEVESKMKDKELARQREGKSLQAWNKNHEKIKQQLKQKGFGCEELEYTLTEHEEMYKLEELEVRLSETEDKMKEVKPNQRVIEQYERIDKEYNHRQEQLEKIVKEREEVRKQYEVLRGERTTKFMQGLETINSKLAEIYSMVTLGRGAAMLELVDNSDPFGGGVNFSVRPPGKAWRNINFLSGGEKTLSSLSFIFAMHHYKPSPFYIMDEIDAALDTDNVSIVGQLIQYINISSQFIVVSLKNQMFELAPTLVGVCKREDCARSFTIRTQQFVDNAQPSDIASHRTRMDVEE